MHKVSSVAKFRVRFKCKHFKIGWVYDCVAVVTCYYRSTVIASQPFT